MAMMQKWWGLRIDGGCVGDWVGVSVGIEVSEHDGEMVGIDDGRCVGDSVGVSVSGNDGKMVGIEDGSPVSVSRAPTLNT